jgi:nucleotide-binding universal stress UspA family protein
MFRDILVSVDGSEHSARALAEAIDIAVAHRARLTILTAIIRPPGWACTPLTAGAAQALGPELEREAHETMNDAVAQVPETVPVTKIITRAPIREALVDRIATGKHDLVVMGSRGRSTITACVLGSVSRHVVKHCDVPVLLVHVDGTRRPARQAPPDAPAEAPGRGPLPDQPALAPQ